VRGEAAVGAALAARRERGETRGEERGDRGLWERLPSREGRGRMPLSQRKGGGKVRLFCGRGFQASIMMGRGRGSEAALTEENEGETRREG